MICALIMAGGKGTRFWPLSTEDKPKQFLNLITDKTMIQMTVDRIKPIIPIERIFVCTGEGYVNLVKEQLPDIPERNIIVEPEGRNTAPCIALSALVIKRYYKESNILVLPSDHLINDKEQFLDIIKSADDFIKEERKAIITFGMEPTRPEIGYGYIKCGSTIKVVGNNEIIKVKCFVEKPNREKAEEYINQGNYLWNGGIFLWQTDNLIEQIKKYIPDTYKALKNIESIDETSLQEYINNNYYLTDKISIDYAVLEKSDDIYVLPSKIGWDDIGSWEAIERYKEKDDYDNITMGNVNCINGANNIVITSNNNQDIIIKGLSNIYVIENDGKIIIGLKDEINTVKDLSSIYK